MGFFKRRKKKKKTEENGSFLESEADMKPSKPDLSDKKQVQHFVLECCEQIIEATKEIEEEKSEYRIVTEYLNDIQKLEELPKEEKQELHDAAESVGKLDKVREEYQKSPRKISDVQFVQMQQEDKTLPDAIRRLKTNETYQTTVKKDMNYLEGEKTEWYYTGKELRKQQKYLKISSIVLLAVFAIAMVVIMVLQLNFRTDTTYARIFVIFAAAVGGFGIYMKMTLNQTGIKQAEVNMNRAIEILNKIKFKYISVTNAVDYAREKYHVKNANELNYIWEQYLIEAREREKFNQTNEDLDYFSDKLVRLLNRYHLYDAQVWVNQNSALMDKKEMVEVKHNLIVRRQKLRSRIDYSTQNIRESRDEIDRLLRKENIYTPEVREIINSIDRLSGIS